jgi:phosphohistidine swiveling domain-containing protein
MKINYEKHQRDYTVLACSEIADEFFDSKMSEFFSYNSHPIYMLVEEGIFYHFVAEDDYMGLALAYAKKYPNGHLQKYEKELEETLKIYRKFLVQDHINIADDILKLHEYIRVFMPIVIISAYLPMCGANIDADTLATCMRIRREYEDVHRAGISLERKLLNDLEKELSIGHDLLRYLTSKEFKYFLITHKLPNDLSTRQSFLLMEVYHGKDTIFIGNKATAKLEEIDTHRNIADVQEIKGNVAFRGTATGRVKLIKLIEDAHDIEKGDILVASMTDPRYLPLMKKAGAIITDEGGITCHAAIVARELKKPCVIGTKIATQVLHDGDLVEVDADNGMVRIIQIKKLVNKKTEEGLLYTGNVWFIAFTRNMSFWHQCLSNEGNFQHAKDFGVNVELQIVSIIKNGTETSAFMHNPNYNKYSEAIIAAVNTKKAIIELKKKYFNLAEKLKLTLNNVKENFNEESLKLFLNEYRRFTAGLSVTAILGRVGAEKITARLKSLGYADEKISEINIIVTYPMEHTPLFNSQLDLLKIGGLVQEGKIKKNKIDTALLEWLHNYAHIPVNFCEDPWTIDDARNQLNDFMEKNCKKEFQLAEKSHDARVKKAKQLLKKIGDETINILAHAIAEGTYLNEFRKNIFSQVSLRYRDLFTKIALMSGSENWRDCFYLMPGEMLSIISGKKISIAMLVKERQLVGLGVNEKGESILLNKETVSKFYNYISKAHSTVPEDSPEDKIIKGSSANKGKISGIAKIILSAKDFHKLNVGEILVTTMTSVDFVPVMGRAAAFVTNEGGITSHASIVAREMNKPCVIGTKIATQVLHDGDLVEVNADKGIVRIIEKSN